jgi:hypothetical protein
MKKRTWLLPIVAGVIGVSGIAVAQIQNGYSDPRLPTPVDASLRESAVDAVINASFPSVAPTPAAAPPNAQLRAGTTLEMVELSPDVWFGGKGARVPTWGGSFLARRTANGSFANVPGPGGPIANAAYDGANIVAMTSAGVFAAPASQVSAGVPVWVQRSTESSAPFGSDTADGVLDRQFSCVGNTCVLAVRSYNGDRATGNPYEPVHRGMSWSFDGLVTFTPDKSGDREGGYIAPGNNVVIDSTYDDLPNYAVPASLEIELGNVPGSPRLARWSQGRQAFVGAQAGRIVSFRPDTGNFTVLAAAQPGLRDAIELPDGALLALFATGQDNSIVITRNGAEVLRSTYAQLDTKIGFGPYVGDNFVTVASDYEWQRRTLWSTKDGGNSWDPSSLPATVQPEIGGLWATDTITVAGAGAKITALVETPGTVTISGGNQQLLGGVRYGTSYTRNGGGGSTNPPPIQTANIGTPFIPKVSDYAPTGVEATRAGSTYSSIVCTGTQWTPDNTALISGKTYYVPCDVQISGSNVVGKTTIVATGSITISGARVNLSPASLGQPVLLAGQSISVSGAGSTIAGNVIATTALNINGANGSFCGLAGQSIATGGSGITVSRCLS